MLEDIEKEEPASDDQVQQLEDYEEQILTVAAGIYINLHRLHVNWPQRNNFNKHKTIKKNLRSSLKNYVLGKKRELLPECRESEYIFIDSF